VIFKFGQQLRKPASTYVALASSTRAIIGYRTGKRTTETTDDFIQDLRQRVIGVPEISTDGLHFYKNAIRDAFGRHATHGVIAKTYSVTHLNVTEASRRYSPAQVIAVERQAVMGEPQQISTSYVERQNLTLRMTARWPTPSQSAAMISICLSRGRMFMAGQIRHLGKVGRRVENGPVWRYIARSGHFLRGQIPGLMIRGRHCFRSGGPTYYDGAGSQVRTDVSGMYPPRPYR
jgi:IS1 family transposase